MMIYLKAHVRLVWVSSCHCIIDDKQLSRGGRLPAKPSCLHPPPLAAPHLHRGHPVCPGPALHRIAQHRHRQPVPYPVVTAATGLDHVHFDPPIQHIVYPLLDSKSQSISTLFAQFYDLVELAIAQSSILVHCAAGISRSSTLVIAYLMKQHSWGFKQAIAFVRESRPCVLPNLGFQRQLKEYEGQLRHRKEGEGHRRESEAHKKEGEGHEQRRPVRPLERRTGSKTSEERKHCSLNSKQSGLPEIGYLGQLKPKLFDMFAQQNEKQVSQRIRKVSHQKPRPDLQFYGTRRAVFKPLKSKSLIDKAPMLGNALVHEPYPRMKASMPIGRIEEVMARRLHLEGGKKSGTQRQLRMKPLHRLALPE